MDCQEVMVKVLPSALNDLADALKFFCEIDIQVGINFLNSYEKALQQIEAHPLSAPLSRRGILASKGYRVFVLEYSYLLFYKIQNNNIYVYRIIDGRRDYSSML